MNLGSGTLATNDATSGISGGSLAASYHVVGLSGTGTFTQTGGTSLIVNGPYLGYNSGDNGTYNLGGSGYLSGHIEYVGNNGTGTFAHSGGSNNAFIVYIGTGAHGSGAYNLNGNGYLSASDEEVGFSGTGSVIQSGGTNVAGTLYLGHISGSYGTYNLSGSGYLQGLDEYLGWSGTSSFAQSGGTNSSSNILALSYNYGSSGTYNLNGGLLTLPGVAGVSGTSVFNFNGGTLQAGASGTSFFGGLTAAYVKIGGANIDVQGFNDTVSQNLLHDPSLGAAVDGGLTKLGSGILTLAGANNYTGATTLAAGTLNVNTDGRLGTAPATPATNIVFSGNATLQAGSTIAINTNRTIFINSGATATFDSQRNAITIPGAIGGQGNLTKVGSARWCWAAQTPLAGTPRSLQAR